MGLARTVALSVACTLGSQIAAAQPAADPGDKDATAALELSLGGTLASSALLVTAASIRSHQIDRTTDTVTAAALVVGTAGLFVAPSFGHWYAHEPLTWGLALRVASPLILYAATKQPCVNPDGDGCTSPGNTAIELGLLAVGVFAAGAIVDIATAPGAARRYNAERHADVAIAPTMIPTRSGTIAGLGIAARF